MWQFPYKHEVAVNAILFLCNKAKDEEKRLSFLSLMKLLFFCDKYHLKKYGRPITGDNYISMDHGPNPSKIYDYLKGVRKKEGGQFKVIEEDNSPHKPIPFAIPKIESDISVFSETDLEIMEEVYSQLGAKSPRELRVMSHKEKAWVEADFDMDYEDFLDEPDQKLKEYLASIQNEWAEMGYLIENDV